MLESLSRKDHGAQELMVEPIGPSVPGWVDDQSVPQDVRQAWINNGFTVLHGVIGAEAVVKYNATVAKVRTEIEEGKDEYGYGERIGQLHQKYQDLLELANSERVMQFLEWAFGDKPVVFGSLNFECGTQQEPHIDAMFFYPQPSYPMAGVWIALEDVHADAGPLFYVSGSHKWPFAHGEDVVAARPELAAKRAQARAETQADRSLIVRELSNSWTADFKNLHVRNNTPQVPLAIRQGDVVIWHSLLAHGGSPRANPALSRKSAVFHFIGRNTKLYTFDQFFLYDRNELSEQPAQPMNLANYHGLEFMRYDSFMSYKDGREIQNPIS